VDKRQRVFKLQKVQPQYEGKSFEDLDSKDRINLENCVIHATVVKQDTPAEDDTSIYHIFERLNSGGRKLQPQEIRTAVYHGTLIEAVSDLNKHPSWRKIYGKVNERMKDQELIIRYLAMLSDYTTYEAPMKEFLNRFVKKNRRGNDRVFNDAALFRLCCDLFLDAIGPRVFRRVVAINVAFYEAAMVALSEKIRRDDVPDKEYVKEKYDTLLQDQEFNTSISQATGNKTAVHTRIEIAKKIFLEE
jgi:hypothetical protein